MSDPATAAVARLLNNHAALPLTDGVACLGCDEVFAGPIGHDRHQAELITTEFLVVPRSEVVGTKYAWVNPWGKQKPMPRPTREAAVSVAETFLGKAVQRHVLAWVPIENGDTDV
jgi:hypothetical protein